MPVPILRTVGNETVLAVHDEVLSATHPRRNERHADGHVLELLETTFTLVHGLIVHGRKPDVDALELLDFPIEPPRPTLHVHCL